MNSKLLIPGIVSLILFGLACSRETSVRESLADKPVKVGLVQVTKTKIQSTVRATGILASKSEAKLGFKTGGIISRIFVEEGETVKSGQVLAQLNLSEISAYVNQAKEGVEKSQRDYDRALRLYQDSLITRELLQNAGSALEVAKNNLQIAEFNLRHSTIVAPSNGKILKRLNEPNEITGPGYPVILFGSGDFDWIVRATVSDKDIVHIQEGDSSHIFFDAYRGDTLFAKVTETAGMADPYTGTYEVELRLEAGSHKLVSGLIANIIIYKSLSEEYYAIPINAVVEADHDRIKVFRAKADGVEKLTLEVSGLPGENLYVKKGLDTSMQIVVTGAGFLDENSRIEVVEQK